MVSMRSCPPFLVTNSTNLFDSSVLPFVSSKILTIGSVPEGLINNQAPFSNTIFIPSLSLFPWLRRGRPPWRCTCRALSGSPPRHLSRCPRSGLS